MGCVHSRHRFRLGRRRENKLHKPEPPEMEYEEQNGHDSYGEPEPEDGYKPEHEDEYEPEHHHSSSHRHQQGNERIPSPGQVVNEIEERVEQRLHHLLRPDRFRAGYRPSFYAAYARAARRWQFEASKYGSFAYRNNVVVKVRSMRDNSTDHEVPAEAIQNVLNTSCLSPSALRGRR
ncbi:hypothetical protein DAEQUDRAFT_216723 [Daedalea quercina L-15889]|uniref:Uncharacterized protein n=1 Tax=Daedalea quercina L-15889 TaxID=1314783 RepID=A0A165R4S2_9APHY|nr:hypothetical protein DAEQUDRAFT_216723 [Daedalea quercina L-15889]